jgi:competence protein ComEC
MTAPTDRLATTTRTAPATGAGRWLRRDAVAQPRVDRPKLAASERAGLFVWVPVCLAGGIALWFALSRPLRPTEWLGLIALSMMALMVIFLARSSARSGRLGWQSAEALRLVCVAVILIALGTGLAALRSAQVAAPVLGWRYYGPIEGRVVQIDRSARDRIRLTLDQVVLVDVRPNRTPARVRLSLMGKDGSLPEIGQPVRVTGSLGPPPGPAAPGSFDFRSYAWFQGLGAIGYTRNPVEVLGPPEGGGWRMQRARMAISTAIQSRIDGQAGAVAAALMTGDRSGIEERTNVVMRDSNLYHIISISGLHMSMLSGFIYAALRLALAGMIATGLPLPQASHKLAAFGALLGATGYLWLSGGGVATERAFVMIAVMLIAIICDRRAMSLRTVALAATLILVYSPESLASPGFQMSFAATIALILSYGPWRQISPHIPFWLRPVAMLVISSLVAGLATAPIAAAHFQRMAHYGILANLLTVPVMGALVMPSGVIAALLAPLGLAAPALWLMGIGTEWMLWVAAFVQGLGGAVTALPLPPPVVLPLTGFGAAVAVLCWRGGSMLRRLTPGSCGFAAGLAMIMLGCGLWGLADRPRLLIASEGQAAGLMTDTGRALSKATGGAYVTATWLREDGDLAPAEQAAARPAWQGDRGARWAQLGDGWEIWHVTGKGAGLRARSACQPRRIVVTTAKIPSLPAPVPCIAFDLTRFRRTGALAIEMGPTGPTISSTELGRLPIP